MEIALNMFVALWVGMFYVAGYLLAGVSLLFLVAWIIDDRYKTNLSSNIFELLKLYLPEKEEKVVCTRCEEAKTIQADDIEDNYCSLCGRKLKKNKISAHDMQVEKMTNKIVLFALAAILVYSISTALFVVFVVLSTGSCCLYYLNTTRVQERLSR